MCAPNVLMNKTCAVYSTTISQSATSTKQMLAVAFLMLGPLSFQGRMSADQISPHYLKHIRGLR